MNPAAASSAGTVRGVATPHDARLIRIPEIMGSSTASRRAATRSPGALPGVLAAVLVWLAAPAAAPAATVHGGGVGSCEYCHVMHGAADRQVAFDGSRPLLLAATSTDLCLTCHGEKDVFGASPMNPPREAGAGNFVWLLEDNLNDDEASILFPIRGEAAGHSIVSPARGINAETRWNRAPGGSFPASALGCTSCHDPHGNGNYRLLHGMGSVQNGLATFLYPAPVASGLDLSDRTARESAKLHSAYRSGITAWCANCHGFYHAEGSTAGFRHPVDVPLDRDVAQRYNAYAGDLDPAGGTSDNAYLAEVPFESPAASPTSTAGPLASDRLNCLTCHRAHGSSAPAAGRWDFHVARLADDGLASGSYPLPSPFADPKQGQLCRKCHDVEHDEGRACLACHGVPLGARQTGTMPQSKSPKP